MLTEPELVVSDGSDDWWLPTAELSPGLTPGYCMTLSCPMIGRLNLKIFTVLGSNLSFLVKYIEVLLAYFFINTNFYRWIWFDLCLTQENHHKIFNVVTTVDFIKKILRFPNQYCESGKPIRCSDVKVRYSMSWEAAWNIQRKVLSYTEAPTLYKMSHSLPSQSRIVWYSNLNILSQIRLGPDIPFFESSEQERGL